MYIAILGRQPALGIAELERLYSDVSWFSHASATFEADHVNIERIGGTQKAGRVILQLDRGDWRQVSMKIVQHYTKQWDASDAKITLGISVYGFDAPIRDIQKTGLILKKKLKDSGISLRLVPNTEAALNTATSHHNKLGLSPSKIELLVVRGRGGRVIVAESTGAQNITALAARDQGRPKRDAFIGMLPPKLAQIMINLAIGDVPRSSETPTILDPFCGTGVILQESLHLGYNVTGSDLNPKMIDYTTKNIDWFIQQHHTTGTVGPIREGDATSLTWPELKNQHTAIVAETYLGQPFSAPPSAAKLTEVRNNCNHIISTFLQNAAKQLATGSQLCIAIPAWRDNNGDFFHLPLTGKLNSLGYSRVAFQNIEQGDLLYYREDQIVARELLVLTRM